MTELKACPFCNGEAEMLQNSIFGNRLIKCVECGASTRWFNNDEEAIKAWNTRVVQKCEVPDGYLILPKPETQESFVVTPDGRYDISNIVKEYAKQIERHLQDEIVKQSLEAAGYQVERTCKPIHWNNAFGVAFARGECSECHNYLLETSKHNPLSFCPHCGARVVK